MRNNGGHVPHKSVLISQSGIMEVMENLSGQIIKSYELIEQIGMGGFGEVYRAIQSSVSREVAIKVILPQHANHPDFIKRFETEAQLVARLEHPHIVPLYDYWREPNSAFLVMRYLRGGSLRESIEREGAWDLRRVSRMVTQIAAALTFAHQHGVIHRDLKSDNILIDREGNAYLGDFGIAKDLGETSNLTKETLLGTPAYLAPEQIRGEQVSAQSDIYALGILAYEALAGNKPFAEMTPATVLYRQLNEPLPDLKQSRPDLPDGVNAVIQRATSKNPADRYETAIEFARALQAVVPSADRVESAAYGEPTISLTSITEAEEEIFAPKNPYKGLRAFQQSDAVDFFGRSTLIERILDRLRDTGDLSRFLAVVGPSGSGKSSVVKAGVMPRLREGALDSELDWFVAEMVPGTHPLEELEALLLSIATEPLPGLLDQLREDERGLVRAVRRILPDDDTELVLVIDQFEEVFTLVDDEERRAHFLNVLQAAARDVRSRIRVLVTLRADFYDRPLLYSGFGELVQQRSEIVLPLSMAELEEVIVEPARRVGVTVEPGLLAAIVGDVAQQAGALPLLQYALLELFEQHDQRQLTLAAYQDIGGTSGALARRAEELYQSLNSDRQELARQIMLRLVTPGEGGEDTRRRVFRSELLSLIDDADTIDEILDSFGRYRLLTFDHDPQTRASTVEVAHEALIRRWDRLRQWLDEDRDGMRMQRRLAAAAQEWLGSGRDRSFLARGARLQQFEDWMQTGRIELTDNEEEFIAVSRAERDTLQEAERQRQQREAELEARARQRLRIIAVVAAIAAIMGITLAVAAISSQREAVQAREVALQNGQEALAAREQAEASASQAQALAVAANARNALAENDPQLALALALEAGKIHNPVPLEVQRTLASAAYAPGPVQALTGHMQSVLAVEYSPDGTLAVSGAMDGSVRLWDVATGDVRYITRFEDGVYVADVSFSPDATHIAAALGDGTVRVLNAENGEPAFSIDAHDEPISNAVYSYDGAWLATGSLDRSIKIWDAANGDLLHTLDDHVGAIFRIAFTPDDNRIVSTTADATVLNTNDDEVDRRVYVWDIESGEAQRIIEPDSGFLRSLDISSDGAQIAVGMWDGDNGGTIRIYDSETGEEIRRLFGHSTPIADVRFTSDDARIISAAWDQTVLVWDVSRAVVVQRFVGLADRILSMDISPDDTQILLGLGNIGDNEITHEREQAISSDIWLWDLQSSEEIRRFARHEDWLWAVDIHPDGDLVATGSGPLRAETLIAGEDAPLYDHSVRLWNPNTGEQVGVLRAHNQTVDSVQFHPDGQHLLTSAWDHFIILWDLDTLRPVRYYRDHRGAVYDVNLNADGSRFVSAGGGENNNLVHLWDTESGEIIRTFDEFDAAVNSAVFSPDETRLLTGSADGVIRLFDIESGDLVRVYNGHTDAVNEVRFAPDGQTFASSSWDDTVRLWDVESARQIRQFAGHTNNTFGLAFSADGDVLLTTSTDQTVRLWQVESGAEIQRFDIHSDWIQEIVFSPDGTFAVSAAQDRTAKVIRILRTPQALVDFALNNRVVRDLTCAERDRYNVTPCPQPVAAD